MSETTDEDEFVVILGSHLSKPNRYTLATFNTRREQKIIAETDYRKYGAMACVGGKKVITSSLVRFVLVPVTFTPFSRHRLYYGWKLRP